MSSGSYCDCWILGIFLDFSWKEPIQKKELIICHEHDFSHLSPLEKWARSYTSYWWVFRYGATSDFWLSLCGLSCRSMSRLDLDSISASPVLAIHLLMFLAFLFGEADAFIGALSSRFWPSAVLLFWSLAPCLISKILMMKHYSKSTLHLAIHGIACSACFCSFYSDGVMLYPIYHSTRVILPDPFICAIWQASSHHQPSNVPAQSIILWSFLLLLLWSNLYLDKEKLTHSHWKSSG